MCTPATATAAPVDTVSYGTTEAAPGPAPAPAASSSGGFDWAGMATQIAGAVMQAQGARAQSQAQKDAYNYQAAVARNNQQIAQWQAQDAYQRGAAAEQSHRLKVAQLKSTQRAGLAARGVALDEGSPLAILQDTEYMGELDANTIRDNTAREAWGHRVQAQNYGNDSAMLFDRARAENPNRAAATTYLTGAMQVADSWYRRRQATGGVTIGTRG